MGLSNFTWKTGTGVYIQTWGQLYEQVGGNPSPCPVKMIDLQLHWVYANGQKHMAMHDVACNSGALYYEDYANQIGSGAGSLTPQSRKATPDGGTLVRLPDPASPAGNRTYHFYGKSRPSVHSGPQSRDNIVAMTVAVRACLDPAASAADRASAKYTLDVGIDGYDDPQLTGTHYKGDLGMGRFKIVKTGMRLYTLTQGSTAGVLADIVGMATNQELVNP